MNDSGYALPCTRDDAKRLLTVNVKDKKWLEAVFNDPRFLAALRRVNIVKPTTVSDSTNALFDVRALAQIRGWNKFEKALLVSHKDKELAALLPLEETYDNPEDRN